MRWKRKKKQQPEEGDRRILEQILWFPKCLDGEWRWLEIAQIDQEYRPVRWFDMVPTMWGWVDMHWNTFHDEPMSLWRED